MIRLIAMDVDGTLTDGGIYISGTGEELKRFDVQDGMGLSRFKKAGGKIALISGRFSPATQRRGEELNFDFICNGVEEKLPVLQEIAAKLQLTPEETAYIGDDINDMDCLRWAGLGAAVANALDDVKSAADIVLSKGGGHGALREFVEIILRRNVEEARR